MRQVNEPVVFVNWQEVGRRCERLGMSVITALYALAIVGLALTAFAIVSYGLLLPWAKHPVWSGTRLLTLAVLEAAGVWFLSLVRQQRRTREWSPILTVFALFMMSLTSLLLNEAAANVARRYSAPAQGHSVETPRRVPSKAVAVMKT
jgi:hypothetical protein